MTLAMYFKGSIWIEVFWVPPIFWFNHFRGAFDITHLQQANQVTNYIAKGLMLIREP